MEHWNQVLEWTECKTGLEYAGLERWVHWKTRTGVEQHRKWSGVHWIGAVERGTGEYGTEMSGVLGVSPRVEYYS